MIRCKKVDPERDPDGSELEIQESESFSPMSSSRKATASVRYMFGTISHAAALAVVARPSRDAEDVYTPDQDLVARFITMSLTNTIGREYSPSNLMLTPHMSNPTKPSILLYVMMARCPKISERRPAIMVPIVAPSSQPELIHP